MNTNVQNFLFGVVMTAVVAFASQFCGFPITWQSLAIIFLISYPWKMPGGNVYSLWGGSSDKNIYSLFGIYQHATFNAVSIFGALIYQSARDSILLFGISICQIAEIEAIQWVSVCVVQKSQLAARQGLGVIIYQIGESTGAEQLVGIAIYQRSGGFVDQSFGIPLWQKVVPHKEQQ